MILCDTNILIEIYRNNVRIVSLISYLGIDNITISDVTRAELLVGVRNKHEMQILSQELNLLTILPIQSDISSMAILLLENFYLSHRLDFHDALIAATAIYNDFELYTLNLKHFVFIPELRIYRPKFE
jgi:predicted nucleic acid-binding protein